MSLMCGFEVICLSRVTPKYLRELIYRIGILLIVIGAGSLIFLVQKMICFIRINFQISRH